jgi:hypothetical protein
MLFLFSLSCGGVLARPFLCFLRIERGKRDIGAICRVPYRSSEKERGVLICHANYIKRLKN